MWNMTSFGILMPATRPTDSIKVGDDRTMQIRARRAKDLDILRAQYMQKTLGPTIYTPRFDYQYRAYCTPHAYAIAMMQMILEINYGKFKPTTERYADTELHDLYNRIWGVVMAELSSPKGQTQHWGHGKHSGAYSGPTVKAGKKNKNNGATDTGWTGHQSSAASPVTRPAIGASKPSSIDVVDERFVDEMLGLPNPASGYRNTRADRDDYEPDFSDLLEEYDDDDEELLASENALVESLYAEIDTILNNRRLAGPIDHSKCDHPASDNARARCRRRRRRADSKRIAEIRDLIDASHTETTYVVVGEVVSAGQEDR